MPKLTAAITRRRATIAVASALLAWTASASAEEWPARPVTLIIPFAAGGPGDAVGRAFAPGLSEALGQTVVIENVGGAGGMTALSRLAKSAPDGYIMSVGNSGTHTFSQILNKKPLYDAVADFSPVSMITEGGYVLVTRKNFPAASFREFVTYAKANQAKMQFGSAGAGSGTHVVCALLNKAIGINVTHVPYRATSLAMQDVVGGRIDYLCDALGTAQSLIRADSVKGLAVLWRHRSSLLPDIPTADEQGLKDFDASSWNAIFLPKGTPQPIVQRLSDAISKTLDMPAVRERLGKLGVIVAPPEQRGPTYLAKFVASEIPKWKPLLASMGVSSSR